MDEGTGIVLQVMLLIVIAAIWLITRIQKMRMDMRQASLYLSMPASVPPSKKAVPLPGTNTAMAHPPSDLRTALAFIARVAESGSYTMPIGWQLDDDSKPYIHILPPFMSFLRCSRT